VRFEALSFLLAGGGVFAVALLASRYFRRTRLRTVVLSAVFACTLGLGIFPGHGELVVVPVLALLSKGGVMAVVGALFAVVWCFIALLALSYAGRARSAK
jgi:predicted permease